FVQFQRQLTIRENPQRAWPVPVIQAPTLIGCLVVKEQVCVKQRNEIMKELLISVKSPPGET
ncbi:MAG: hypothetical protein KUL86_08820, partial [Castellaniella sp.]|nr:hypothetical protein [Castellaniella sp.]